MLVFFYTQKILCNPRKKLLVFLPYKNYYVLHAHKNYHTKITSIFTIQKLLCSALIQKFTSIFTIQKLLVFFPYKKLLYKIITIQKSPYKIITIQNYFILFY